MLYTHTVLDVAVGGAVLPQGGLLSPQPPSLLMLTNPTPSCLCGYLSGCGGRLANPNSCSRAESFDMLTHLEDIYLPNIKRYGHHYYLLFSWAILEQLQKHVSLVNINSSFSQIIKNYLKRVADFKS